MEKVRPEREPDDCHPGYKSLGDFSHGKDELNLAEFPLAAISDRFLDGTKTVVIDDTVWDRDKREHVPRKLTISGSDRYGLPTAKDDDVLLACVQLSHMRDFATREVPFTRYGLLELLRWRHDGRQYNRLATSMRRWKGINIYSDRAFYDHAQKSWVNRDFGVFDNLYVYERERGPSGTVQSWFIWNEVIFSSFQAGYLKSLDWDLYCRLTSPIAKRLYRFLDKRFYHGDEVRIDLQELAFRKLRLAGSYNAAQLKRLLQKPIKELESLWELRALKSENRFRKLSRGKWEALFLRKKKRVSRKEIRAAIVEPGNDSLEIELSKRGVGPAMAAELVEHHPAERISETIELFDWHNARGQERGPGFLVSGIRSSERYVLPKGFRVSRSSSNSRIRSKRDIRPAPGVEGTPNDSSDLKPFQDFWNSLGPDRKVEFEADAFRNAEPNKIRWYEETRLSGRTSEAFRTVILRDHFERAKFDS